MGYIWKVGTYTCGNSSCKLIAETKLLRSGQQPEINVGLFRYVCIGLSILKDDPFQSP